MVGHTGNYLAAVKAMEVIDECLGRLLKKCEETGTAMILTADHGNCDEMVYADGQAHTSHTKALVPCVLLNAKEEQITSKSNMALKDLAATLLYLLGIKPHELMSQESIFQTNG